MSVTDIFDSFRSGLNAPADGSDLDYVEGVVCGHIGGRKSRYVRRRNGND